MSDKRTMTGLWSSLTDEQRASALAYDGPENIGDPAFRTYRLSDELIERCAIRGVDAIAAADPLVGPWVEQAEHERESAKIFARAVLLEAAAAARTDMEPPHGS